MSWPLPIVLRAGTRADAPQIHALIEENLTEGRLLRRELDEVACHSSRFIVAVLRRAIVGCAELAPLSHSIAEVRSLAVARHARGQGVGSLLVDALRRRAQMEAYSRLTAFTHAPAYFSGLGFTVVPRSWLPEKALRDCARCTHHDTCGQSALALPLETAFAVVESHAPAASSHV